MLNDAMIIYKLTRDLVDQLKLANLYGIPFLYVYYTVLFEDLLYYFSIILVGS